MAYANGLAANGGGDSLTSEDPIDKRKAFVGGLSPDTTEEDLNTYFAQFGPVQHSVVKRDLTTGLSRGFAFVTFADATGLKKLASVAFHTLKGKKIDPKPATPRPGQEAVLKIFVGGVDTAMEEDDVKAYFEKFGKVRKIEWPKDKLRDGAKKNFVFVEFEDAQVVEELVKSPKQTIGSRQCDIKKAVPFAAKQAAAAYSADPYGNPYGGYQGGYYGGAGYDPAAYGGYYGASAGYDPAAYGSYGDPAYAAPGADGAAAAAYDPYGAAPAAPYDPYGASAAYPGYAPPAARGGFRGRGAPAGARGATRGATRGYHPYSRV